MTFDERVVLYRVEKVNLGSIAERLGGLDVVRAPLRAWHTPDSLVELGTHKTVTARFWPLLSGKSPQNLSSCSLGGLEADTALEKVNLGSIAECLGGLDVVFIILISNSKL